MNDLLTARDAYLAGAEDYRTAQSLMVDAIEAGQISPAQSASFYRDTLLNLWQARIDRGELRTYDAVDLQAKAAAL